MMNPFGVNPQSPLFGFAPPTFAPMQDVSGGGMPAPAYVNGAGGRRLTPGAIDTRSRIAQSLIAAGADTSPVASWTQGAARIVQALVGNLQQRRLDLATEQNAADSQAALAGLGTGDSAQIAAILSNPYLDDGVKEAAKLQWQEDHKAVAQPTEFERSVLAAGYQPGTPEYVNLMRQFVENKANPIQAVPGVAENGDQILRFIRPSKGGDPASTPPAEASPPATLPPDFDFGQGGPTQPASATFR